MSEALDVERLRQQLKGSHKRLVRLSAVFFQYYRQQLDEIEAALRARDSQALRMAAHTYKGTVISFAAQPSVEVSLRLEMLGRDGVWDQAEPLLEQLRLQAELVRERLQQLPQEAGWVV